MRVAAEVEREPRRTPGALRKSQAELVVPATLIGASGHTREALSVSLAPVCAEDRVGRFDG